MVLTVSFVISPVIGLSCHRRLRKMPSADLTPASRRQDHTTSPSASSAVRQKRVSVHRIPCPTFVTIAKRPFVWAGTADDVEVIWGKWEPEYFFEEDWTDGIGLIHFNKLHRARRALTTSPARRLSRSTNIV
jgi:hypothetical protein